jgi:hypothetical protein
MSHRYEINKEWRKKHPSTWQKGKSRYYKKSEKKAHNGRQHWTIHDINSIINKDGKTDTEIAGLIGRSVKAIQIMRCRVIMKTEPAPSTEPSYQETIHAPGRFLARWLVVNL